MTFLQRGCTTLLAALALLIGQHAALQHGLAHALEAVAGTETPATPPEASCDEHYACAQLSGAIGGALPPAHFGAARSELAVAGFSASVAQAPRLAYRAQAPPKTVIPA